jgi:hypothetical protein
MTCNNLPTILGTGITGLAMSHHLSKAKIKHVLIGEEPSDVQRFGESIDITGTIELRAEFLEQHNKFAGRKIAVDFWAWGNVVFMDNRIKKVLGRFSKIVSLISGFPVPEHLWHLDRIGFDRSLFQSVVKSPYCVYIAEGVPEVEYEPRHDMVQSLRLKDRTVVPSFTFDVSNVTIGLSKIFKGTLYATSKPLVASFSHLENPPSLRHHDWQDKTTIFLLREDCDGIDAVISFIPTVDDISLIITTESTPSRDAQTIHRLAVDAMDKRGFPFPQLCRIKRDPRLIPHQYFFQDRVVGKNWFIGGPPSGAIWFPSASGVGVGLLAARLAPKILKNPMKHGGRYHNYVKGLAETHWWYHRFRRDVPAPGDTRALDDLFDHLVTLNVRRTLAYARARGLPLARLVVTIILVLVERRLIFKQYCTMSQPPIPSRSDILMKEPQETESTR